MCSLENISFVRIAFLTQQGTLYFLSAKRMSYLEVIYEVAVFKMPSKWSSVEEERCLFFFSFIVDIF